MSQILILSTHNHGPDTPIIVTARMVFLNRRLSTRRPSIEHSHRSVHLHWSHAVRTVLRGPNDLRLL